MYYPEYHHTAQTHDKYGGGAIPIAVPPPGVPLTPRQQQQQQQHPPPYSPYQAANLSQRSHAGAATVPWSSGLCHCCDDPSSCIITAVCPCITFGQIAEILNQGEPSCVTSGALYGLLLGFTGFACLFSCFYRSKMRAQYDLNESPFADCLVHFCCETCALCQEFRELKARGFDMGIGWEANVDRQKRGIGMVAPGVVQGMAR